MFDVSNPATLHTVFADSGRAAFSSNGTDMILQLYDGHTREVSSAEPATFRRVYFQRQVFGVPDVGNQLQRNDRPDGYRGDREMTLGMLQAQIDTLAKICGWTRDDNDDNGKLSAFLAALAGAQRA